MGHRFYDQEKDFPEYGHAPGTHREEGRQHNRAVTAVVAFLAMVFWAVVRYGMVPVSWLFLIFGITYYVLGIIRYVQLMS